MMRRRNHVLWHFILLFVTFSSESQFGNSTTANNDKQNISTVRYEVHHINITATNRNDVAETVNYNTCENCTKNNNDEELRLNFTKNDDENNSTSHELRGNLMQVDDKNDGTLYEDSKRNVVVVPYEMCKNSICIPFCCSLGSRMIKGKCTPENVNYSFPNVYKYTTNDSFERRPIGKTLDQVFQLTIHDPCQDFGRFLLDPDNYEEDEYVFLVNGSLYLPHVNRFIESYCLAIIKDEYEITVCFSSPEVIEAENAIAWGLIISLPFLLTTFVMYSILPELRNIRGFTLRGYVGSLFVAYTFLAIIRQVNPVALSDTICIIFAFIIHFSSSANFFWLNVMCFDIWWTFGDFRLLQGNMKQRERKKYVIYSIYAWGSAIILATVCAIMDFIPSIPKELIRPEIGVTSCWFNTNEARVIYFYGSMGVTVICNICLFISTALKIVRQKKNIAHDLEGSESRRHNDNKQWFNLYLKLFIVMGLYWYINLTMEIISWLYKNGPLYIGYLTGLTNTLQGLTIFIIFVWKENIKQLLLQRFNCQNRCSPKTPCITLQESLQGDNSYVQTNCEESIQ